MVFVVNQNNVSWLLSLHIQTHILYLPSVLSEKNEVKRKEEKKKHRAKYLYKSGARYSHFPCKCITKIKTFIMAIVQYNLNEIII